MTSFTTDDRIAAENKTRYCSSCLSYKPENTGRVLQTSNKNIRRWACASCLNKTSEPHYKSKGK